MSLNQVLRTVGGALGSALAATILASHTPHGERFPSEGAFTTAFLVGALACVGGLIVSLAVVPPSAASTPAGAAVEELELLMEEAAGAGTGPSTFDGEDDR